MKVFQPMITHCNQKRKDDNEDNQHYVTWKYNELMIDPAQNEIFDNLLEYTKVFFLNSIFYKI